MKFSLSIEYAIHSLVYISSLSEDLPVLVADVARAINVSETYLRKVFQQLARSAILTSQRGAKGGFLLSRLASDITLKDIVESMDGSLPTYTCFKQQRKCSISLDCPVQREFARAQEKMAEVLDATSIADLDTELTGRLTEGLDGESAGSGEKPEWLRVVV